MRDLYATNMKAKLKSRLPNDSYRVVTYSYSLILRLFGSLTPKLWKKNSPLNSFSQSLSTVSLNRPLEEFQHYDYFFLGDA